MSCPMPVTNELLFGSPGLKLRLPANAKGVGKLINHPDSEALIQGVRIRPYSVWADDRGHFQEVVRTGQGLVDAFPAATTQVSAALSYPGTVKAFRYHTEQSDCWAVVAGLMQVALVDLRAVSPTFGQRNTFYIGPLRPWQLLIPPGVGHGYKVIGSDPAVLVYVTDRTYNPRDEGRLAYNLPELNYDWETQYK
jgi:dTDP-4-dehydrorhamnose 3,5-epimerase